MLANITLKVQYPFSFYLCFGLHPIRRQKIKLFTFIFASKSITCLSAAQLCVGSLHEGFVSESTADESAKSEFKQQVAVKTKQWAETLKHSIESRAGWFLVLSYYQFLSTRKPFLHHRVFWFPVYLRIFLSAALKWDKVLYLKIHQ